jgi:hypothetical protein
MRWRILPSVATFALIAATSSSSFATEKEFVYHQATGKLTLKGKEIAQGYSGKRDGKNNPDKEAVRNVGPIPQGLYTIGKQRVFKKMTHCFDLTPLGHIARDRSGFLIHGDSRTAPGTASRGCIVLPLETRKKIAASGIVKIRVVRD